MNQPSSSTSSSEPARSIPDRGRLRRALATFGWVLAWLVALDFAVNLLFAYPSDPKDLKPGTMALYFDYGRSMEGRLRRSTRADPAASAPITQAGWYEPLTAVTRPAKPGGTEVSIYGMSHSVRLAEALQATSLHYSARSVGAPGATTNWSYGAFLRDRGGDTSKVAVLAIMSSTLPMITSPAPMDWNTSFAMPYTADRFVLKDGKLEAIRPPYESFAGYVRTLNDPAAWQDALAQFQRTDPFYDPLLVRATWLDNSTLIRLARRAWSQRRDRAWRTKVLDARHFDAASEPVRLANAIVADFAREARHRGQVPVIYVVNSFGYGDQLYRALAGTLEGQRIPYLSTHTIVSPSDPAGYLPDSHFTDANDRKLAESLTRLIDAELAKQPGNKVN
jgi:hypothetical protein